jgi:hypothetical protein
MLIFVFARFSYGRSPAILAEFMAVPNAPSDVVPGKNAVLADIARQAPQIAPPAQFPPERPVELGGPIGPEPTRFGDWERNGRCIDF